MNDKHFTSNMNGNMMFISPCFSRLIQKLFVFNSLQIENNIFKFLKTISDFFQKL